METKGINILEEAFRKHNGADATISISHKLYGKQKLQCKLNGFCNDCKIGFNIRKGHDIFIYSCDLVAYGIEDGIYFADNIMEIKIKLNEQ